MRSKGGNLIQVPTPLSTSQSRKRVRVFQVLLILASVSCVWSDDNVTLVVVNHNDEYIGDDHAYDRAEQTARRRLLAQKAHSHFLRGTLHYPDPTVRTDLSSALPLATASVPLHATSGTHHVFVFVGSPPQRQTLIVDTGSRLLSFPCSECLTCGKHANRYFDHNQSSTAVIPLCGACRLTTMSSCSEFAQRMDTTNRNADHHPRRRCVLSQKYTEGSSWHAFEAEDIVWFGGTSLHDSVVHDGLMQLAIPHVFGCQTSTSGLFRKQYADGILGLALHDETSIVKALYDAGAIRRHAFSLCFSREGGHLALGGTAMEMYHSDPMQFVPLEKENGFYPLSVIRVQIGDECITCGENEGILIASFRRGKGTILDSGTTDTFLPKAIAVAFEDAWRKVTGLSYSTTRTRFYSFAEFSRLPDVTFTFKGNATLSIRPESYMENVLVDAADGAVQRWASTRQLTNRIYVDEPLGAVLGANAMIGYDVLFDVQERRVGLARSDCRRATNPE